MHLGGFFFQSLLFDFSPVKKREEKNSLERKREIICFMFCDNFFHKNTVGESSAPFCFRKAAWVCKI